MYYAMECTYCGHRWEEYLYSPYQSDGQCPRCRDRKIRVVGELTKRDVFGYSWRPPKRISR